MDLLLSHRGRWTRLRAADMRLSAPFVRAAGRSALASAQCTHDSHLAGPMMVGGALGSSWPRRRSGQWHTVELYSRDRPPDCRSGQRFPTAQAEQGGGRRGVVGGPAGAAHLRDRGALGSPTGGEGWVCVGHEISPATTVRVDSWRAGCNPGDVRSPGVDSMVARHRRRYQGLKSHSRSPVRIPFHATVHVEPGVPISGPLARQLGHFGPAARTPWPCSIEGGMERHSFAGREGPAP
jgi:hypothetical protein